MEAVVREYDAKLDSKKRLTLREAGYEYYHVSVLPDQRIILEPRVLISFSPAIRRMGSLNSSRPAHRIHTLPMLSGMGRRKDHRF